MKTLKDIEPQFDKNNLPPSTYLAGWDALRKEIRIMIKQWIKFLEKEPQNAFTEYPQGYFQAEILREIFQVGD